MWQIRPLRLPLLVVELHSAFHARSVPFTRKVARYDILRIDLSRQKTAFPAQLLEFGDL